MKAAHMKAAHVKAVFLDKDGTLVDDIPHNVEPERIHLCRGAGPALRLLMRLGYRLFVVTNQPGIAFGHFAAAAMEVVGSRLRFIGRKQDVAVRIIIFERPVHQHPVALEYLQCRRRRLHAR